MGTISSGVGLISGLDIQNIVNQLMAIEARPRTLVEQRVVELQTQKSAFLDVNAKLQALKSNAAALGDEDLFETKKVTSSSPDVLSASVTKDAAAGTYQMAVVRLVSTHQMITRGLPDTDTTTLGARTLRFDSHRARLDHDPRLTDLNGQAGVQRGTIRITDREGGSAEIDLTRAVTLDDVTRAINNTSGVKVTASVDGDRLLITDDSGAADSNLRVEDLGSTTTATDLGIAANVAADTITGTQINRILDSTLLSGLNDGNGVRTHTGGAKDMRIDLDGTSFDVALTGAMSIEDVIDAINTHTSNLGVAAAIGDDHASLKLTGTGTITVTALNDSNAAADLGILGSATNTLDGERLLATLGSKLIKNLNGGAGITTLGTVAITDRNGDSVNVDLSAASSIDELITTINTATATNGLEVTVALNDAGNGLQITDTTDATASNLIVTDVSGTAAADLGLDTGPAGVADDYINGQDRDLRYINETTAISSLNGGRGINTGKFTLTDSNGVTATVDLTQGNETTIQAVIAEINSRSTDIVASVNATGDGILLTDTAGGGLRMKVEENGSTTAADLGILGEDDDDDGMIDGSFEKTVEIDDDDTLEDMVNKINATGPGVSASIVNDGTGANPFRLNLTSELSGIDGTMLFDDDGLDLQASTLVRGEDAVVLFGSADPTQALLITSPLNALTETIEGVTINLNATSPQGVALTITNDDDAVVDAVESVVTAFNDVLSTIGQHDSYDAETQQRGALLGDPTVNTVRNRLLNLVNAEFSDVSGSFNFLTQVGLRIGSGATLQFDSARFREAMAEDAAGVRSLFTATTIAATEQDDLPEGVSVPASTTQQAVGFGQLLEQLLKNLTDTIDGTLTLKTNSIDNQVKLANDRIDSLNDLLADKRERLESEFVTMEQALAQLQNQQNALGTLNNLALTQAL